MGARDAGFLYREGSHMQLHIGCVVPFSIGHPSWEDDAEFRIEGHVVRWGLPAPGGEGELREAVAHLPAQPLDRSRPQPAAAGGASGAPA